MCEVPVTPIAIESILPLTHTISYTQHTRYVVVAISLFERAPCRRTAVSLNLNVSHFEARHQYSIQIKKGKIRE